MTTPKPPYKIRQAKPTDAMALLGLMKDFLDEIGGNSYPPVNDQDCLEWLLAIIRIGAAWVAISERKIVGSLGCNIDHFAWNKKALFAHDEWYYVKPSHRKGYDIAEELLNLAKERADNADLPFIFSINSGKDKRIDRFIEMQGFSYKGCIGVYYPKGNLEDGQKGRIQQSTELKQPAVG